MTESTNIEAGARVRITAHTAGVVVGKDGDRIGFVGTVKADTEGSYAGPHPAPTLAAEWHLIEVERDDVVDRSPLLDEALGREDLEDRGIYAPLHSSQFEELVVDAPPNGNLTDELDDELDEGDDGDV